MKSKKTNRFGRRSGRGWRPWLLVPKWFCVIGIVGGWMNCLILSYGINDETALLQWQWLNELIEQWLIPATFLPMILGIGLFAIHPLPFWRMRWFRAKLILVIGALPICYFGLVSNLTDIRLTYETQPGEAAWQAMESGVRFWLWLTVLTMMCIVWLGRHKPRLGLRVAPAKKGDERQGR